MGSVSRVASISLAWTLFGCGSDTSIFVSAEFPTAARSVVIALEQEERRFVEAHPASLPSVEVTVPEGLSDSDPAELTIVSLSQRLEDLGLSEPGPLAPATGRTRALSSLSPLSIVGTRLFEDDDNPVATTRALSEGLAGYPVAKVPRCPDIAFEFVSASGSVRDAVEYQPELAVGLTGASVTLLRPGGSFTEVPLPEGEFGEGIGLSRNGRVWVTTSSNAVQFDPESGTFGRPIPLPRPGEFRGVFDDDLSGRLYLVSTEVEIWEYEHASGIWTLSYAVPDPLIRRAQVVNVPARIVPQPSPGRFFLAMEEVSAVVDYAGEETTLYSGDRVGSGFPSIGVLPDRSVIVSESFSGDLYLFDGRTWQSAGQGPARLYGLSHLEGRRFMFLSLAAVVGVLDLDDPRSCPEVPMLNWDNARTIVRSGDDFWVGIRTNLRERGWGRLIVTLPPP